MYIKTWKIRPQKLLIIDPFISQSSPDQSPQPRIYISPETNRNAVLVKEKYILFNISYYEISGPDICSLICGSRVILILDQLIVLEFQFWACQMKLEFCLKVRYPRKNIHIFFRCQKNLPNPIRGFVFWIFARFLLHRT